MLHFKSLTACLLLVSPTWAQDAGATAQDPASTQPEAEVSTIEAPLKKRGLLLRSDKAVDGYTLLAPLRSKTTWLVDMQGEEVHSWQSEYAAGNSVYLLEDGSLLRCGNHPESSPFQGGGEGGVVERFSWEGELLWSMELSDEHHLHHHDIEPLPNGNILVIAWEGRSVEEALAAGREPDSLGAPDAQRPFTLWPDMVLEIKPTTPAGGQRVWEWHAWDHLIQDYDDQARNYGVLAEHPERIDVNAGLPTRKESAAERRRREELEEEMRALGYLGEEEEDADGSEEGDEPRRGGRRPRSDWLHTNGIDYNAEHDLIALSIRTLSEVWIIDHSTSTEEAAGSSGGRHGRGGDLLYRWGNPARYGQGGDEQRTLFGQHDPRFVTAADGSLRLTVFNNGEGRGEQPYSTVDEILLPMKDGRFQRPEALPFGPAAPIWSYAAEDKTSFFSSFVSGAHRLPGGNTLICSGAQSRIFEVTPEGEVVWDYMNPLGQPEPRPEGQGPTGPGAPGQGRARGGPPEGDPPGPTRGTGPPGRPVGGDGGPRPARRGPGGGGGGMNPYALFRATRIPAGYAGLSKLRD